MERRPWKAQEDCVLRELANSFKESKWSQISRILSNRCPNSSRSGRQCRERWFSHLSDKISKEPWQQKEDQIIFKKYNQYGGQWKRIAKHLSKRSENDIKNHVYAELRKGVRRVNTCLEFKFDFKDIRSISSSTLSELFEQENKKMDHINKNNRDEGIFFLLIRFAQDKVTNQQVSELRSDAQQMERIYQFLISAMKSKKENQQQKSNNNHSENYQSTAEHQYPNEFQYPNQQIQDIDISIYLNIDGSDGTQSLSGRPQVGLLSITEDN